MNLSVIHATRRPNEAFVALTNWLMNASGPVEYILSVDTDDTANYDYEALTAYEGFKVIRNPNRSAVDAFNRGAEAATGDLFVCISDDMECFKDWDLALINTVKYISDFYLKVQDGLQPVLVTMPIFDRVFYERLGYVWNPDYFHMFVDQEATAVAIMTGKFIKSDLMFKHAHYTTDRTKYDSINRMNDATWAQGEALFNERLKTNFDIESPIVPYSEIKWK